MQKIGQRSLALSCTVLLTNLLQLRIVEGESQHNHILVRYGIRVDLFFFKKRFLLSFDA
uniref:Uncharacterized protein n=1 Tax=Setaria italica TaxID=4555 RepID=K3XTM1_SETIT